MTTTAYNSLESAAVLLRRGADHRAVDHKGMNVLHYLAYVAAAETLEFFTGLAEAGEMAGINITRRTNDGLTPLQALNGRPDVSPELQEQFGRLLYALSCAGENAGSPPRGHLGASSENDGEDIFYDAPELAESDRHVKYRYVCR